MTSRPALALLAALLPAAAAAQIPERPEQLELPELEFEVPTVEGLRHELSNGVAVYVAEDRTVPLVEMTLVIPVGSRLDPAAETGLAELTGSMLRRGGAGALTADRFDEEIDFLGATLDSFGGETRSGVTFDCLPDKLPAVLDLVAEALRTPRFEGERLDTARENLLTSLERQDDDPLAVLDREWNRLMWGEGHPRTRRLSPESVEAIERQDLLDFHRRHWGSKGAVVALSGDVDRAAALALLESRLGSWPAAPEAGETPAEPERRMAPPGLYQWEMATPQAKVRLGHEGVTRKSWLAPEPFAVILLSELLTGGGPVSRVRRALRAEEGLAYRVRGGIGLSLDGAGEFAVTLETDPARVAEAVEIIIAEMERVQRERVSEQELELTKRSLIDVFPLLFDSAEEVAGRFAEDELIGRPHSYWTSYREGIEAVTPAQVQRAAREHLDPGALRVLVIGPWSEIGPTGLDRRLGRVEHLRAP